MSPESIRDEINRGGRLVIHIYCVSILVMTFKRPTDIRLIKAGHNPAAASWPYVFISLLFGWWGFPWGPIYTIECIYRNLCGGIDVTDGVLEQILPRVAPPPLHAAAAAPAAPHLSPTLTVQPPKRQGFDLKVAGIIAAACCAIIGLGLTVYCYQKSQDLTVVLASGLDQPYGVVLNGKPYTLRPQVAQVLHLPEGEFVLQDAPGGKVLGRALTLNFSQPLFDHLGADQLAVINPDGVAVFANAEIPYYHEGSTAPKEENAVYSLLVNHQSYQLPKPDFVIEPAANKISMPQGTTRLVKTRLTLVQKPDLPSLLHTLNEKFGYPAVRDHLMLQARHRSDEILLTQAVTALKAEDMRPFFTPRLADRPVLVEWHRYYQEQMERFNPEHDLEKEYAGYLEAEPDNGALIYLLGRQTSDQEKQEQLWDRALAAAKPCPYAYNAKGFDAMITGNFDQALANYDASVKAGLSTTALKHYRRLALLGLGRAAEILPELAAERKDAPLDLLLAEKEIQARFAVSHDRAELIKSFEAYLKEFRASKPTEKDLADVTAYLQASIAYLTGDLAEYAKQCAHFDSPYYRFRKEFTNGRIEEAGKALADTPQTDANADFLLYLLACQKGEAAAAEHHFQNALAHLKKGDNDNRRVAGRLSAEHPDATALCQEEISIESKRIMLTALGLRYSADKTRYHELARKLNIDLEFPYQFLQSILAHEPPPAASASRGI